MNFLKKLKIYFQGILVERRDPFVKGSVQPGEPLARFIFEPKHFDKTGKVKPAAFAPHSTRLDFSVFRSINADEKLLTYLGDKYVASVRKKPLVGWATFNSDLAIKLKLKLNPDGKPHKRHLNIESWPSNNQMERVELANSAEAFDLSKKN